MSGTLQIDPGEYVAASSTVGTMVASTVRSAADYLTDTLGSCGGMAGSDPAGAAWANEYDPATTSILAATQNAINGAYQLAGLIEQTGFNYSSAENASTFGDAPPPVDTTLYAEQRITLASVPPAAGYNPPSPPGGWALVQSCVGRVWPNGHQDKLRRAATAWNDGARFVYDASYEVAEAVGAIALQVSPERDDAITVCNRLRDNLEELGAIYNTMSRACEQYAGYLDEAHRQAEHELRSLLEWMAGIEIAGAALSIITFGASEVVSQATVAARTALTGTRIAAVFDRLAFLARDLIEAVTALTGRVAEIVRGLDPLLATERFLASTTRVTEAADTARLTRFVDDALPVTATAEWISAIPAARQFRSPQLLLRHFKDHGKDFQAVSEVDYATRAEEFFQRALKDSLPRKVDEAGTIRLFDPATNTFGSYSSDGTILTFFKPSSPTYWGRQPGS